MELADLQNAARTAAAAAGIPENLFFGLIKTESGWNPSALSGAGAIGLTQVMPWWTTAKASPFYGWTLDQLRDPIQNLTAGAKILADELNYFGDAALAAMAYNAGRSAVNKAIQAAGTRDPEAVSAKLPAAETRAYWQKVLTWASHYAGEIGATTAAIEATGEDISATVSDSPAGSALLLLLVAGLAFAGWKR
jgi:soluble lytic murein transglycosylase